jgi:hypothetical protein
MVVDSAKAERELNTYIEKRKAEDRKRQIQAHAAKYQQEQQERNAWKVEQAEQRKAKLRRTAQNISSHIRSGIGFMQGVAAQVQGPQKPKKRHTPASEPSIFGGGSSSLFGSNGGSMDLGFGGSKRKGSDDFGFGSLFGSRPNRKKRRHRRKR